MVNQDNLQKSINEEIPDDIPGIREVNQAAFGRANEANLVDQLRVSSPIFISMVAKITNRVVGHILFTPVELVQQDVSLMEGLGLAPLSVLPEVQGMGIGTALCRAGLRRLETDSFPFVVVLGHPGYYPRFGFEPASHYRIIPAYPDIPDEAFLIRLFKPEFLSGQSGVVHYRPEFDDVT